MFAGTTNYKEREKFQNIIAQAVANALEYVENQGANGGKAAPRPITTGGAKLMGENSFGAEESSKTGGFGGGNTQHSGGFGDQMMSDRNPAPKGGFMNKPTVYF